MKSKTEYPLAVLKAIEPWLDAKGDVFYKCEPNDDYIVKYQSVDFPEFYFTFFNYHIPDKRNISLELAYIPHDPLEVSLYNEFVLEKFIPDRFDSWVRMLTDYRDVRNPHEPIEDKILKDSQEEVYEWFELVDDDAHTASYDFQKQIVIDKFLENSIRLIAESKTEENAAQLDELIKEAEEIKANQQNWTKGKVVKALSWFVARAKKYSVKLGWEIVKELGKEVVKKALSGEININLIP